MKLTSFIQEEESRENEVNRRMAEYEKERQMGLGRARVPQTAAASSDRLTQYLLIIVSS